MEEGALFLDGVAPKTAPAPAPQTQAFQTFLAQPEDQVTEVARKRPEQWTEDERTLMQSFGLFD